MKNKTPKIAISKANKSIKRDKRLKIPKSKLPKHIKGATIRQVKAIENLAENGGNKRQALLNAGYSQSIADNPTRVTESKGWQLLVDKYLPDDLLQQTHLKGLKANKSEPRIKGRDNKGCPEYEYIQVADHQTRHKYLHTAYNIKGKYPKERGTQNNIAVIIKNF